MNSNYRKTEWLLVNYGVLKRAKAELLRELHYVEKHGLPNKSKDIILFEQKASFNLLPLEIKEAFIMRTKRLINRINSHSKRVVRALETIKDDLYSDVIDKYYFEGLPVGKIAFNKGKSDRVILNNKKRLVNKLSETMF